jgi:hypothetical protein
MPIPAHTCARPPAALRLLAGFYLHHLKHIPLHATVPWGGRLRLRKEGILAEEVLNTPKFPSPINRSPFLTPKDTREEL